MHLDRENSDLDTQMKTGEKYSEMHLDREKKDLDTRMGAEEA